MVALYVGGKRVGELPDAGVLAEHLSHGRAFELRDETGGSVRYEAAAAEPDPLDLPAEELERRLAGEFVTLDELKRRLGWSS